MDFERSLELGSVWLFNQQPSNDSWTFGLYGFLNGPSDPPGYFHAFGCWPNTPYDLRSIHGPRVHSDLQEASPFEYFLIFRCVGLIFRMVFERSLDLGSIRPLERSLDLGSVRLFERPLTMHISFRTYRTKCPLGLSYPPCIYGMSVGNPSGQLVSQTPPT